MGFMVQLERQEHREIVKSNYGFKRDSKGT